MMKHDLTYLKTVTKLILNMTEDMVSDLESDIAKIVRDYSKELGLPGGNPSGHDHARLLSMASEFRVMDIFWTKLMKSLEYQHFWICRFESDRNNTHHFGTILGNFYTVVAHIVHESLNPGKNEELAEMVGKKSPYQLVRKALQKMMIELRNTQNALVCQVEKIMVIVD